MLNGDGIENGKKTTAAATTVGLISQKNSVARAALFLYISLPSLIHDYNVKLSSYKFYDRFAACVPVPFLFHCRS